ncbi:MAG: ACP S-malonyltransferase [Oscillospiraceae bacterium]|nr:ACP S-malonyltransferase [Oscillospiraceae bacterium]
MRKIAFVFSGQGAQYPGMGKELTEVSAAAKAVFDTCDSIRPETSAQCFSGTKEELTITSNTQPDMFAVELAAASALLEAGIVPSALAGFSVGEISALGFSGAVSMEDAFRLVCRRGELMQDASNEVSTGMTAVIKLSPAQVEELAAAADQVYPVNYNSEAQTVCAGLSSSMAAFRASVKAAGGRAIPLKVAGAFHSPFMHSAAVGLVDVLAPMEFGTPKYPLYSNVTAQPYEAGRYKELLSMQLENPVRWQTIVENMAADGVDTFVEVGPGNTLTGLIKRILPAATAINVENAETLKAAIELLK